MVDSNAWRTPKDRRDGSALVLVLAITAAVTLLAVRLQTLAVSARRVAEADRTAARLRQAAADGVREAMRRLAEDEDRSVDGLEEDWARPWEINDPSGVNVRVTVNDDHRTLDLNNLGREQPPHRGRSYEDMLIDAFHLAGRFQSASVLDALKRRLRDPEDTNAVVVLLRDWGDLPAVEGFSTEMFRPRPASMRTGAFDASLCDVVGVASGSERVRVNVNTATPDTLRAVFGMEQDVLVDAVVQWRTRQPHRSLETLLMTLDEARAASVQPWLTTASRLFTVRAQAYANGRSQDVRARLRRTTGGRVEILAWSDGQP